MYFSVLASGSKANSVFVASECGATSVLIDCGLSAKQTSLRLAGLGINPQNINAILVTHGHIDHVRGVSVMSRKYKIPVFVTEVAQEKVGNCYSITNFNQGDLLKVESFELDTYAVVHDAPETCGVVIREKGVKLGILTDAGKVTTLVRARLRDCDSLVLESNHDKDLLASCMYPWELKQRIASTYGHLSNDQAAELIKDIAHKDMENIVLAHLSENSNSPELAFSTAMQALKYCNLEKSVKLICAGVESSTELLSVQKTPQASSSITLSNNACF